MCAFMQADGWLDADRMIRRFWMRVAFVAVAAGVVWSLSGCATAGRVPASAGGADGTANSPVTFESAQPAPVVVILAGDSNTAYAPLSADVAARLGKAGVLAGTQARGWQFKGSAVVYVGSKPHEGYPGKGVAYLSARLPGVVKATRARVVVLNIGANDMWRSLNDRRPIDDAQALRVAGAWCALADACVRAGASVVPVLPTTPANAPRPLSILRAKIGAWAARQQATPVDLRGCANDGVHFRPAAAGYGAVAARYEAGIRAADGWSMHP